GRLQVLAILLTLSDEIAACFQIVSWYSNLRKVEVIRPEVKAFFRLVVSYNVAAEQSCLFAKVVLHSCLPAADYHDILHLSVWINSVHVDIGNGLLLWIDWVLCVIGGSPEPLLFSSYREEYNRPRRILFQ